MLAKYKKNMKQLSSSRLLRAGFGLTISNMAVGVLGYAYQVLMGRMLSLTDFALFSAIMALFMIVSSPFGAMYMVISRRVSSLRALNELSELRILYLHSHGYILLGGILLLGMLIPLAGEVQEYLRSASALPVWLFAVFLIFSAFSFVNNAFFQGMQRFGWLAGVGILNSIFKIILSGLLIILGFKVIGAIAGALIAAAATWFVGMWVTYSKLPAAAIISANNRAFEMKSVLPVLIASVAFAAMTQLDMVLVNWYFPPDQAGLYAAASVLGKAVLYLPGGLVLALYPMVAENHAKERSSANILLQAVAATLAVCGAAAVVYWMLGGWLINLLYGPNYNGAGELLRWYGFAILPMALVMVAEYFLIAKGRVLFVWLFLGMTPIEILAIHLWHSQLWMVVLVVGACGAVLAAVGYGILWRNFKAGSNKA